MQEIIIADELPSIGQQLNETQQAIHEQKQIRALARVALQEARAQHLSPDSIQDHLNEAQDEHAKLRSLRIMLNVLRNEMGMNRYGQPLAGGPRDRASYYTAAQSK